MINSDPKSQAKVVENLKIKSCKQCLGVDHVIGSNDHDCGQILAVRALRMFSFTTMTTSSSRIGLRTILEEFGELLGGES